VILAAGDGDDEAATLILSGRADAVVTWGAPTDA
jgi:hypothetical protein